MSKLPKQIYVKWDGPDNEQYLNANQDADKLLEFPSDQQTLGVYELKHQVLAKSTVTISKNGRTS